MFRKMRRGEKATDVDVAEDLLRSMDFGILSVLGDNGYPYGVPVNYVYDNGKIFFHGSSGESHKIDGIRQNEKVSFTIVTESDLVPEKLDTNYTSVIVFGKARVLTKESEAKEALLCLLAGLAPEHVKNTEKLYQTQKERFVMVEIGVEHITGKMGR